jgi:DNA mismatch repair ATPase MutS
MLKKSISNGNISKCKLSNKTTKFKNAYFPALIESIPVKNSYNLNKQILITGPNAAGKTTLLKTTLFNILFSQQTGFGCYDSATITPYDKIHCYINIPDTSGRDSLFQAEARRCKNILDAIEQTNTSRHFCVFDELYSGTNPYEAIGSATSYLKYLNKYNNVTYMITTHFIDLCNRLESDEKVINCCMKINIKGDNFVYTYKLDNGISNIKGGVKVLKDLEYPDEIIVSTNTIINTLTF